MWEEAIHYFQIPRAFHDVSMKAVKEKNERIGNFLCEWLRSGWQSSLFLSGSCGSGKTYTSFALLRAFCECVPGLWVIYIRSHELDAELLQAIEERQEGTALSKYRQVPLLFIDDLGTQRLNERIVRQYYNFIDHRMNDLMPTVFTSNIPMESLEDKLGERIASRIFLATEIKFPKRDLRKGE